MLGIVIAFAVPAVTAHNKNNQGTLKVHDDEVASPDRRNEPHVSCDFWIEGFNMFDDSGVLEFKEWPPTGEKQVVTPTGDDLDWSGAAEEDGKGFHFLNGAYQLPEGHYRVEAFSDGGHPGNFDHNSKSKMFWVDPCEPPCPEEQCPPPPPPPPDCPDTDLDAAAQDDGTIDVTVTNEGDDFNLYHSVDGGDFEFVATLADGDTFTDGPFAAGTSVDYVVHAFDGERETEGSCARATATAIPFFGGAALAALALVGSAGAYVYLSRRRS